MPRSSHTPEPKDFAAKLEDHQHHLMTLYEEVSTINKVNSSNSLPNDPFVASSEESWSETSISPKMSIKGKPSTSPTSLLEPGEDLQLKRIVSNQAVRDSNSDLSSQSSVSSTYLPSLKGYIFDDAAVEGLGDHLEEIYLKQGKHDSDPGLSCQSSASSAWLPSLEGYIFDDAAVEEVENTLLRGNEQDTKRGTQDLVFRHDEEREAVLASLDPILCKCLPQIAHQQY